MKQFLRSFWEMITALIYNVAWLLIYMIVAALTVFIIALSPAIGLAGLHEHNVLMIVLGVPGFLFYFVVIIVLLYACARTGK